MKNFEKYEKEIKEVIGSNGCLDTLFSKLSNMPIYESDGIANWLYEDYKEPLLTDEERDYLKAVIKPFEYVTCIQKENISLVIYHSKGYYSSICLDYGYKFRGLEEHKIYSLKELGL